MDRRLAGTFPSVASMKLFFKNSSHLPIGCDLSCRFLISWSFSSIAWCNRAWNSLSFWTNSSNNLWNNENKALISFSSFKFSGKERSYYIKTGNILEKDDRLLQLSLKVYSFTIDWLWPISRYKHSYRRPKYTSLHIYVHPLNKWYGRKFQWDFYSLCSALN